MAANMETVVDDLVRLGVPAEAAPAYLRLWQRGPTKAASLGEALRVSRPQAYRILDLLVQMGFATRSIGRPVIYQAVPPETLVAAVERSLSARAADVERLKPEIIARLRAFASGDAKAEASTRFAVLRGGPAILGHGRLLCLAARRAIDLLLFHADPRAYAEMAPIFDLVRRRAEDGVECRILVTDSESARAAVSGLQGVPRITVRFCRESGPAASLLVDGCDLLQLAIAGFSRRNARDEPVAIAANAAGLVESQRILFETFWRQA